MYYVVNSAATKHQDMKLNIIDKLCSCSSVLLCSAQQELLWSLPSAPTTLNLLGCFSAPCVQI